MSCKPTTRMQVQEKEQELQKLNAARVSVLEVLTHLSRIASTGLH